MRPLPFLLLISALTLATAHYLALQFYLYWQYLWFDIPMHALGGAVAALMVWYLIDLRVPLTRHFRSFAATLVVVLIVGLVWEYFELVKGLTAAENYWQDTLLDVCMDLLGGAVGYILGSRLETLE